MLTAISPIDGRYASKTSELSEYFSEYALIKYRVQVEVTYFLRLLDLDLPILQSFPQEKTRLVENIISDFSVQDAQTIKEIEKETNHDVKAVEYYIRNKFESDGLGKYGEMIHFGLTSQDVNNTAVPLSLKEAIQNEYIPAIEDLLKSLSALARDWWDVPMLAHTHGQPASPTLLGKELYVFVDRLNHQLRQLRKSDYYAKFGGAVGNLNAHYVTYPGIDWIGFAEDFVRDLGLKRIKYTTQIDHYDHMASIFDQIKRIQVILIDLCRDIWTYISMNYFGQKVNENEVGSSTMPHKVNPIDFENAEGNLGIANALLEHLSSKLPVSRMQRDLTDSTVLRNIGVPLGHGLIAFKSIIKGLSKLKLNEHCLRTDLENNWAVVAEAYQTILRREGVAKPYELLKAFTRGKGALQKSDLLGFIDGLPVTEDVKKELRLITPSNYTGKVPTP